MDALYLVNRNGVDYHLSAEGIWPEDWIWTVDGSWCRAADCEAFASRFRAVVAGQSNPARETEVRLPGLTVIDRGHDPIETAVRIGLTVCGVVIGAKVGAAISNRLIAALGT
jgi:hypothetical protein